MKALECVREQELLDALASSRWPGKCEPGLRAHVEGCELCRDTLAVALPLLADGEAAYASAHVPSSGIVWWRAQMRARREAERVASRPITIVQAIALVCGAVLIAAISYWASPTFPNWRETLPRFAHSLTSTFTSVATVSPWSLLPWLIFGVWLVLVPLAIYLAIADDDAK